MRQKAISAMKRPVLANKPGKVWVSYAFEQITAVAERLRLSCRTAKHQPEEKYHA
jgi:hypothetical protein